MTDAGFFKGTTAEQDTRFADKKKKLMKTMKFGDNLSEKVDMTKINLSSIRPWIVKRITELLNFEDEVVCDYVFNQLEVRHPDPKDIQINITGFLNSKNARIFLSELWDLLLSAMQTPNGVPAAFLEAKKEEILHKDDPYIKKEISRREEVIKQKVNSVARTLAESFDSTHNSMAVSVSSETTKVSSRRRSSTSRSTPSPRRSQKPSNTSDSRKRQHSSTSESSDNDSDKSGHSFQSNSSRHEKKSHKKRSYAHRDRSRSGHGHSSRESRSTKRSAQSSDWRKDLLAGRRRSPPQMSENTSYGHDNSVSNESRRHGHDASDYSSRSRDRRYPTENADYYRSHRGPPMPVRRDNYSRRYDSEEFSSGRRSRHRSRSRSPDVDRRRFQRTTMEYRLEQDRRSDFTDSQLSDRRHRYDDRMSDAHAHPNKDTKRSKAKAASSSSDHSSSSDSNSSSDDDSSGTQDSDSSSSDSEASEIHVEPKSTIALPLTVVSIEGPELPPMFEVEGSCISQNLEPEGPMLPDDLLESNEPEGPSLPPDIDSSNTISSHPTGGKQEYYTQSSSSSSDSSSQSGDSSDSDSSSSNSDDDCRYAEDKQSCKRGQSRHEDDRNGICSEGPALPPNLIQQDDKNGYSRELSENTLRKRALASMSRTSHTKRGNS